jgi:Na+(H+)/acetate symporter ActP
VFCLMVGTAGLPHILMRFYTTPSVREARQSVGWSLLFIVLLYMTAPALAVLIKYQIFTHVVGTRFDALPAWIANWSRVDPLLSVSDINHDGILQLGELHIGSDILVLAMPEIAGLPYVLTGLVAAGGLAAALSTADGLLLTISNALSHDFYYRMVSPRAISSAGSCCPSCCCCWWPCARPGWLRRSRPTSCSWSRPPSRWRPPPSSRPWCWACSGSGPTAGARWPACSAAWG